MSSAATSPAGRSYSAARTAMRGASGATGSSPMCSSTTSDASQSARDVDAGLAAEPVERLDERLAGDAVQRERERVDGGRDEVGADPRRDERVRERRAARAPGRRARPGARSPRRRRSTSSCVTCGSSAPVGSLSEDARRAELARASRACSTSASISPVAPRAVDEPDVELAARRRRSPRPASRRFETSFSGSWSRKTSIPLSAAQATKRRTMSGETGFEPTRNRPRSASPSGVVVRASIARIRSHGLSTPRRTAASKTPPPETSRHAKPAPSRISAIRSTSPVGTRPASGSCESRRIVVSTSCGTAGAYSRAGAADAPAPAARSRAGPRAAQAREM